MFHLFVEIRGQRVQDVSTPKAGVPGHIMSICAGSTFVTAYLTRQHKEILSTSRLLAVTRFCPPSPGRSRVGSQPTQGEEGQGVRWCGTSTFFLHRAD